MSVSQIIVLNGTSSAGKSTLADAIRASINEPFCHYSSDQLADAGFRVRRQFARSGERAKFFEGFHRSIGAFAEAGNNLIVEHIVEEADWWSQLQTILGAHDVFWVGVHAPIAEIERRERERGDRYIGEARYHLKTHDYCSYDIEVDTTRPLETVVAEILASGNLASAHTAESPDRTIRLPQRLTSGTLESLNG